MGIMTGILADFRNQSIGDIGGRIIFAPRAPDSAPSGHLLVTKPIIATASSSGAFNVNLVGPESTTGGSSFDVYVEWLDASAGYIGSDYFGVLRPPPGGGLVKDYLTAPTAGGNSAQWWVAPTPPDPWPNGMVWVNTTTWDLTRKVA